MFPHVWHVWIPTWFEKVVLKWRWRSQVDTKFEAKTLNMPFIPAPSMLSRSIWFVNVLSNRDIKQYMKNPKSTKRNMVDGPSKNSSPILSTAQQPVPMSSHGPFWGLADCRCYGESLVGCHRISGKHHDQRRGVPWASHAVEMEDLPII